jgi:hypothetical protein
MELIWNDVSAKLRESLVSCVFTHLLAHHINFPLKIWKKKEFGIRIKGNINQGDTYSTYKRGKEKEREE